jgi:hypothetical protein
MRTPNVIRRAVGLSLAIAVNLVACNFFVDTGSLSNGACSAGYKACNNECVPDSPEVGCAQAGCTPCDLPNATPLCSASGQCTISVCDKGFTDCDGNAQNGCETETDYDPTNCGHCHAACSADTTKHVATAACSAGACVVGTCDPGWGNCNQITADGCEVDLSKDPANCGGCHMACLSPKMCTSNAQGPVCM